MRSFGVGLRVGITYFACPRLCHRVGEIASSKAVVKKHDMAQSNILSWVLGYGTPP